MVTGPHTLGRLDPARSRAAAGLGKSCEQPPRRAQTDPMPPRAAPPGSGQQRPGLRDAEATAAGSLGPFPFSALPPLAFLLPAVRRLPVVNRGLRSPVAVPLLTRIRLVAPPKSLDCSTPGFPVPHSLLEFVQVHVPWISDATQPSHPLWGQILLQIKEGWVPSTPDSPGPEFRGKCWVCYTVFSMDQSTKQEKNSPYPKLQPGVHINSCDPKQMTVSLCFFPQPHVPSSNSW